MKIKIFGFEIEITIVSNAPVSKVKKLLNAAWKKKGSDYSSHKIFMIKELRKPEISAILINAGLVPDDEIRDDSICEKPVQRVGLVWAKEWCEKQFPEIYGK